MAATDTHFYLQAVGGDVLVGLESHGENLPAVTLEVSSNGTSGWTSFPVDGTKVTIASGSRLYFRSGSSGNTGLGAGPDDYRCFVIDSAVEEEDIWMEEFTVTCASGGNIMSLLSRSFSGLTTISSDYCFSKLFQACDRLTSSPLLPARSLSNGCYYNLFAGCNHLASAPSLAHVTTLADSCCSYMFADCMVMAGTAELPTASVELKDCCYEGMFSNCAITAVTGFAFQPTMKYKCFDSMFYGCSSLTNSGLPAGFSLGGVTTLERSCFAYMFSECSSLVSTPQMPPYSVPVKESCYEGMFEFCDSLENVSSFKLSGVMAEACCRNMFYGCSKITSGGLSGLRNDVISSVTELASECFQSMFSECLALTETPAIPNISLAYNCFAYMFSECSGIVSVSSFSVPSNVAEGCYGGMFSGCTRLTNASFSGSGFRLDLVSGLEDGCFASMFSGCIGLTGIIALPGTSVQLKKECYERMFAGCTGITSISSFSLPADIAESCCREMFMDCIRLNVIGNGMFSRVSSMPRDCFNGMFKGCTSLRSVPSLPSAEYEDSCCAYMFQNSGVMSCASIPATSMGRMCCAYMFDGCKVLDSAPAMPAASVELSESCCLGMFNGCISLAVAPSLPATSLAKACYQNMFAGCTSLASSPNLPATTLENTCYRNMFSGCTGLTSIGSIGAFASGGVLGYGSCYGMFYKCTGITAAPDIAATSIDAYCCSYMYYGCTGLLASPQILATVLSDYCFAYMFYGCTSLASAQSISAIADQNATLASHCFYYMFANCSYLTSVFTSRFAPAVLKPYCYSYMFYNCQRLSGFAPYVDAATMDECSCASMFAYCYGIQQAIFDMSDTLAKDCYKYMYNGCTGLVRVLQPWNTNSSMAEGCYSYMFSGCTSLVEAPNLNATSLAPGCYRGMFYNCNALKASTYLPATTLATECYSYMFAYCSALTYIEVVEALNSESATLAERCFSYMFASCASLTCTPRIKSLGLAKQCYEGMFSGCTGLVSARQIPNAALAQGCYSRMFLGCSSLSSFVTAEESWTFSYDANYGSPPSGYKYLALRGRESAYDSSKDNFYLFRVPDSVSGDFTFWDYDYLYDASDYRDSVSALKSSTYVEFSGPRIQIVATPSSGAWSGGYGTWSFSPSAPSGYKYGVVVGPPPQYGYSFEVFLIRTPSSYSQTLTYDNIETYRSNGWVIDSRSVPYNATSATFRGPQTSVYGIISAATTADAMSLPQTTLAPSCYEYMFSGCSSLTGIPSLPASDLSSASRCYAYMFQGCNGLQTISSSALSSTKLGASCYEGMFYECTNLAAAPTLSARTLAASCYAMMFRGCTSLTSAGGINLSSVTTLADSCCMEMFYGCSGLSSLPTLPGYWISLAPSCYRGMFSRCAITTAPSLTARVMAPSCYESMFDSCSLLTNVGNVNLASVTKLDDSCFRRMFSGCTSLSAAVSLPSGIALADSCYEEMFAKSAIATAPTLASTQLASSCYAFMFSECESLTNINNINLSGVTKLADNCCREMFSKCTALTHAPALPQVALAESCYEDMFRGCVLLGSAPSLSPTVMANSCFAGMFYGCEALEDASDVDLSGVTKLADECCREMFYGCSAMLSLPSMPSGIDAAENCYYMMFYDCSSITSAPAFSVNKMAKYCFSYMFYGCNALEDASDVDLSGTTRMDVGCCSYMFANCTSLAVAPLMPTSDIRLAKSCYERMFSYCQSLESAPLVKSQSMAERCCREMFYRSAIVSAEDVLPASGGNSGISKLGDQCFYGMFQYCESLTTPPVLPGSTVALESSCYSYMFYGCSKLESAPALHATVMASQCYDYMFCGCGKETYSNGAYEYSGLSVVPSMTLMALAESCCRGMFGSCYNLSDASGIDLSHLTRFDKSCFESMFSGCKNLSSLPEFPLSPVAMSERCCYQMFYGCGSANYVNGSYVYTGFTSAPALAISSLAERCCYYMFNNCKNLESAGAINISNPVVFPKYCFYYMFNGCSKLADTPVFSSSPVTLNEYSCYYMFSNCGDKRSSGGSTVFTGLSEAPDIEIASVAAYSCCGMFSGCKNLSDASGIDMGAVTTFAESCFRSMFSSCEKLASAPVFSSSPVTMADRCCDSMFYSCGNKTSVGGSHVYTGLSSAPSIKVATSAKSCFYYMFNGCSNLTNSSGVDLSALTDFAESCFEYMFSGCERLSATPTFSSQPISIGKRGCYGMFYGCGYETWNGSSYTYTGISEAPSLSVAAVGESGCYYMFSGCYNIRSASGIDLSGLSALAKSCFQSMFNYCTQLENSPTMPAASVAMEESCYESMFYYCRSLVSPPALESMSLAKNCYRSMFYYCGNRTWSGGAYVYSGLRNAPALPATVLAEGCYQNMFYGCYNLGTGSQMPVISATTPATNALKYMFYNCENLDKIKIALMSDPSDSDVYYYWASYVKSTGTLYVPTGSTVNAMVPSGWSKATY